MHSQWDFLQGHAKTHYPIKARSKEPEKKIQIANFDQRRRTQNNSFLNRVKSRQQKNKLKKVKHEKDDQFREDANAKRIREEQRAKDDFIQR